MEADQKKKEKENPQPGWAGLLFPPHRPGGAQAVKCWVRLPQTGLEQGGGKVKKAPPTLDWGFP